MKITLPYVDVDTSEPCGFQNTFFECPPDHMATRRVWGWTRRHAQRRASR